MKGTDLIKKAGAYLGRKWGQFCRAYGFTYPVPWCCIYMWYVFSVANASKLFYSGSRVCNCRVAWNWCRVNLKHIKMKDAMPGDIVFFTWTGRGNNSGDGSLSIDHIGFIRAKGNVNTCYTIEGNTGTGNPKTSSVMKRERAKKYVLGIYRPKYKQETSKTNKAEESAKKSSGGTKNNTANTTVNKKYKVVSKKGMNIRKDHNTKSEIAGVIACGETFKATKESDNWVYGSYKGIKGWVKVKSGAVTYLKAIK